MRETIKKISLAIILFATVLLCGCGDDDEVNLSIPSGTAVLNFQSPSEELIKGALMNVPEILQVAGVTEGHDPNDKLGKPDGYTSAVYFEYSGVMSDSLTEDELIDKGTDAGGCVEVFKTVDDAKSRLDYLNKFGSLSGINTLVGTSIVRLSSSVGEPQELFNNVVSAIAAYDVNSIAVEEPVVEEFELVSESENTEQSVNTDEEAIAEETVEITEENTEKQTTTMYATDKVKLRQQPNTDCEVLNMVNAGDEVTVIESGSDGWSSVTVGGVEGYIKSEYLSADAPTTKVTAQDNSAQAMEQANTTSNDAPQVVADATTSLAIATAATATAATTSGGDGNGDNFNTYDNAAQQNTADNWVLNTNPERMKIHHPHCASVKKIAPENYATSNLSIAELQQQGYTTCGQCFR